MIDMGKLKKYSQKGEVTRRHETEEKEQTQGRQDLLWIWG